MNFICHNIPKEMSGENRFVRNVTLFSTQGDKIYNVMQYAIVNRLEYSEEISKKTICATWCSCVQSYFKSPLIPTASTVLKNITIYSFTKLTAT